MGHMGMFWGVRVDQTPSESDLDTRVAAMRDGGATWAEIERAFGISRQQARYAYQKAKRVERRAARREKLIPD